jgi:methylated-DNA-[protein]-cysteine S-methyltransferase
MAYYDLYDSPLGPIFIGGSAKGLHRVEFQTEDTDLPTLVALLEEDAGEPAGLDREGARAARMALASYFAGASGDFDLPLAPRGTKFQERVWKRLQSIAAGKTTSYGAVARAIRRPTAARAVGAAVGRNPLAIIVPCHRVVNTDGGLGGYASGLDRKRWLLAHEERWA